MEECKRPLGEDIDREHEISSISGCTGEGYIDRMGEEILHFSGNEIAPVQCMENQGVLHLSTNRDEELRTSGLSEMVHSLQGEIRKY